MDLYSRTPSRLTMDIKYDNICSSLSRRNITVIHKLTKNSVIQKKIESHVQCLVDNPTKLKRFQSYIELLKYKRHREKNIEMDFIKRNIKLSGYK